MSAVFVLVGKGEFYECDEVVSAAEEHDRKGEEDRNQEEKVYGEEESGVDFAITKRGEKVSLN